MNISLQTFLEVVGLCVIVLGGQAWVASWFLRRRPEEVETEPQQRLRFLDRPLCAVDRTPITEPYPVKVDMLVELINGISLPATIYICQHCMQSASLLIPMTQHG